MPTTDALFTWLPAGILAVPLIAFVLLRAFGDRLPRAAGPVAVGAMALAFSFSLALFHAITHEDAGEAGYRGYAGQPLLAELGPLRQSDPYRIEVPWLDLGGVRLPLGLLLDYVSVTFCVVATGLAAIVLLYATAAMRSDVLAPRTFAWMSFGLFAMLGLALSGNLLTTFVFWQLAGLGVYMLTGLRFGLPIAARDETYQDLKSPRATGVDERYLSPAHAQKKAFVMGRIGDAGFLAGMAILLAVATAASELPRFDFLKSGSLSYSALYAAREKGVFEQVAVLGLTGPSLLTAAGLLFALAAMARSAQFPLHTWLPESLQAPPPAAALFQGALSTAAGVILIARLYPLLTPGSHYFIAVIGGLTAFLAASMALLQWDILAVVAYATIAQVGLMLVGLGSADYTAAISHLFTHAVFGALLYLCAGTVIRATGARDLNRMGGLRKALPLTWIAMLAGALAMGGAPLFSGAFSGGEILGGALARALEMEAHGMRMGGMHFVPFLLCAAAAGMTAFAMFRLVYLVFHGKARSVTSAERLADPPHAMLVPQLLLAVFCLGFWWSGRLDFVAAQVPVVAVMRTVPSGAVKPVLLDNGEWVNRGPKAAKGWLDALMVDPASPEARGDLAGIAKQEARIVEQRSIHRGASIVAFAMAAIGAALAFAMYGRGGPPERLLNIEFFRFLHTAVSQLWFFDRIYQDGVVPAWKRIARALAWFDARGLEGGLDRGGGAVMRSVAAGARAIDDKAIDRVADAGGWTARIGPIPFLIVVGILLIGTIVITLILL